MRSLSQCVDEAKIDITVATNLMETRLLCGNSQLLQLMLKKTCPIKFGAHQNLCGKMDEQKDRHHKHQDTEYNLEPNIKEAPGGLRDIQLINWTAKRYFNVHRRSQLSTRAFFPKKSI